MKLSNSPTSSFVPDGRPIEDAWKRITHLGIGAHQDDLETMAYHGILQCFRRPDLWFGGVICTSGGGSPRSGPYADVSNEDMALLREKEQERAAVVGEYGALVQLRHSSAAIKDRNDTALLDDLKEVFSYCRPSIVYTHNPADKHETHVAVALAVVHGLRQLPAASRPERLLGCEVWRSLDWLSDEDKVALDIGGRDHLAAGLLGVYDSQIAGGKRYDLAAAGRRRANATYRHSHQTDVAKEIWYAMDLSPLLRDPALDIDDYVLAYIDKFRDDVASKLRAHRRGSPA